MDQPIIVRYLEENEKPDRWAIVEPLTFETPAGTVEVPAGFITDFASVPVFLWGFFPPIGRHNRACVLHDYWYDNRLFEDSLGQEAARRLADDELLARMNEARPHRKIRNYCMYLACRWFGRSWWIN
ncbi:DUF1353 domain-containing protein [Spirosoma sp. HMF3257]|uniref:DUF1353 domain-containing protein n=1 Tax=Spirosoma telluris TaxID=2183553 RepID=A0A327NMH0_9BACT|nr:DUF1353 domain-containing protein [Spirosoma telluris]RAI75993.1 hypothetical protein HMF3257_20755 [Spirosoma telluris]